MLLSGSLNLSRTWDIFAYYWMEMTLKNLSLIFIYLRLYLFQNMFCSLNIVGRSWVFPLVFQDRVQRIFAVQNETTGTDKHFCLKQQEIPVEYAFFEKCTFQILNNREPRMAINTRAVIQIRRHSLGYSVFVFEPGSLNLSWPELSILWAAPNNQDCSSADQTQIIALHCSYWTW